MFNDRSAGSKFLFLKWPQASFEQCSKVVQAVLFSWKVVVWAMTPVRLDEYYITALTYYYFTNLKNTMYEIYLIVLT